ncbi:MAG TPA: THUMP domain-containing protein [Methanomassiliicoccales archaeon]|nr:THUMP domain-containing protein [Methanomassiliicoccales archaeon]
MKESNLLVSCHSNAMGLGETEVRDRLREIGVSVEGIEVSEAEGVLEVLVSGESKRAVAAVRASCALNPSLFVQTHHWVPIEKWVESKDSEMARATGEIGKGIMPEDKWMLHLHKRHVTQHSGDLIRILTDPINRGKVDLKRPDKIVVVELLGQKAGIALVAKDEILDVNKVREECGMDKI